MAKRKKKSASKSTKPGHKRREDEGIAALSAPATSSGLRRKTRSSVTAGSSKYLSSPPNDEDTEGLEVEECSGDDLEAEEPYSEDDEDGLHSEVKFFHSRATVHAGKENVSETGLPLPATLRLAGNLLVDVPIAVGGGLHGQNAELNGGKFLDPSRGSDVGSDSGLNSKARNGGGREVEEPQLHVSALPGCGKEFASLGSPHSDEAINSGPKSCTPPVRHNATVSDGIQKAATINTYHEIAGRQTRSTGVSLDEGGQQECLRIQLEGEGLEGPILDSEGAAPCQLGSNAGCRAVRPEARATTGGDANLSPAGAQSSRPAPAKASQAPGAQAGSASAKWRDLFGDNRSAASCVKLTQYAAITEGETCTLFDRDSNCRFSDNCLVGYIAGKSPGFKAINGVIQNVWKCSAALTIHDSGWLIFRFESEEAKLEVLNGGPYLIYGRPLILKNMPKFFDFSESEMSLVPVWVKFPNLPLECWSVVNLSKIASTLGRPIQCDRLTGSMDRLSYARVLVEVDIMKELRHSVTVQLPNGTSLCQFVIYETLPTHCKHCKVLSHGTAGCKRGGKGDGQQVGRQSVFNRLGPLADSAATDAGIMFPEAAADENGWEVVRGKRNQRRRGVTENSGAQVRAAAKRPATAAASAAAPVAGGPAAARSASIIAPAPTGSTTVEDSALVCAHIRPVNEQNVEEQYCPEENVFPPITGAAGPSGSHTPGFALHLGTGSSLPAEGEPGAGAGVARKSGLAAVGISVLDPLVFSSATTSGCNEADAEAIAPRDCLPKVVDDRIAVPLGSVHDRAAVSPGLVALIPANAVTDLAQHAGDLQVYGTGNFPNTLENEMRGVLICQGSLGSPIAGAARLGGSTTSLTDKGSERAKAPSQPRTDSVQIAKASLHSAATSKGAGELREAGARSERGMPTRSGRRRSRGGGINQPPSEAA